jgi:hypothetical protein
MDAQAVALHVPAPQWAAQSGDHRFMEGSAIILVRRHAENLVETSDTVLPSTGWAILKPHPG